MQARTVAKAESVTFRKVAPICNAGLTLHQNGRHVPHTHVMAAAVCLGATWLSLCTVPRVTQKVAGCCTYATEQNCTKAITQTLHVYRHVWRCTSWTLQRYQGPKYALFTLSDKHPSSLPAGTPPGDGRLTRLR